MSRTPGTKPNAERDAQIKALALSGMKNSEIALLFNLKTPDVYRIVSENGTKVKNKKPPYDPEFNYALQDVKIHTDDVYAYRLGYKLGSDGTWSKGGGYEQRPFGARKIEAKK